MRPEMILSLRAQRQHVYCPECWDACAPPLGEFLVVVRLWGRWLCPSCRPWGTEPLADVVEVT